MVKVLGIGGSPRKGGNSDILLKQVLQGAERQGCATCEVHLRDYQVMPCIACEQCRKDEECTGIMDGMQLIYPKIREARGLVVTSPVYSYNVTAQMKAFIDRLYAFYYFADERPGYWRSRLAGQGRKAVIVVVGEQGDRESGGMNLTLEVMRRSIEALGYDLVGELPVPGIFQKGKVRKYPDFLDQAEALGMKLATSLAE